MSWLCHLGGQVMAFQKSLLKSLSIAACTFSSSSEDSGFSNHLEVLFQAEQDHSIQDREQGVFHSADPTEGKMKVLVGN